MHCIMLALQKKIHFIALRQDSQADLHKVLFETSRRINKVLCHFAYAHGQWNSYCCAAESLSYVCNPSYSL